MHAPTGLPMTSFLLMPPGTIVDPADPGWPAFAQSWDDLPLDTWMADGGTYRRRRYGAFRISDGQCVRLPHRPHFQELDDNPLNGGVERCFAPMDDACADSTLFRNLMLATAAIIERQLPMPPNAWDVEVHQFRIEASAGQPGLPTPEGLHRDGRDWVLILSIGGANFTGGETRVEDLSGRLVLSHRLGIPGEALLLDDKAKRHETSPIAPADERAASWRDTLVLTFAVEGTQSCNLRLAEGR